MALPLSSTTQQLPIDKPRNYVQAGEFYRALSERDKADLALALSADLSHVKNQDNLYGMLSHFYRADKDYGTRLTQAVHANLASVQTTAMGLKD